MRLFRRMLPLALLALGLPACNKEAVDPPFQVTPPTPLLAVAPASLAPFSGRVGMASAAQSIAASGTALQGNLSATAPAGYELALDAAGPYTATVSATPAGASVVLYVRLAAAPAPATLAGSVVVSSAGTTARQVAVTGTVSASVITPPAAGVPSVGSFAPASGAVGTLVSITGTNFLGATAVTFNGVALPGFSVMSATVITVAVPTSTALGSGLLAVTTPGGTASSATAFTVVAPGPTTLRTGTMMAQGGVMSGGSLALERDAAGTEFVRFNADFRTDFHTGSLGVYLAKSDGLVRVQVAANPANVVRVGTITRDGAQTLAIPGSATGFTHVIIHCDAAQYNFGAALMQ
ncbi:hypothetical protein ACVWYF_004421 [Hymenobacter sp. UYAg731]